MNCSNCGEVITPGNTFCTNCGMQVVNNVMVNNDFCTNCGAPILPNSAFCTNCGVTIDNSMKPIPTNLPSNVVGTSAVTNTVPNYNNVNTNPNNVVVDNIPTNRNASVGFALALVGFLCMWYVSIPGLIVSYRGLQETKTTGEKGKGLAIAGIALSCISLGFGLLSFLLSIVARTR